MQEITSFLQILSVWSSSLVTILGALVVICKPFRKLILRFLDQSKKYEETSAKIDALSTAMQNNFDSMKNSMNELRDEMKREINDNEAADIQRFDNVKLQIDEVVKKVQLNERDRLKQTIFSYGNQARDKRPISGEEFRYLQQVFEKYTDLGGNDIAHDEFTFITNYYNERRWENK